ncbi:ABL181Wp [Eremothecium gossypii ATCC 10895]|uniref:ABL181Wp n=1 Tax=Eremothecium gossypii (strain ATCC 10895 / CBS 109.51 / FGSC 9923 / NRRL Y-1056) TaxID=284811 RepID=Q75E51_EREGS|nr:ABL181Wp [Eremothecium gossypii ATCC 10895]AAS50590.1 ABL181Wp [Eremothecium gossypii ATCC 10895]AEY94878.1 FABL181Wp [Eremothecium gossypii FDAG1]
MIIIRLSALVLMATLLVSCAATTCPLPLPVVETVRQVTMGPGQRILFVGDVHGMYDQFHKLLAQAGTDADTTVVLLGDFLTRGTNPKGMLHYLLTNSHADCVLGNNDIAVLFAAANPDRIKLFNRQLKSDHVNASDFCAIEFSSGAFLPPTTIKKEHVRVAAELGLSACAQLAARCSALTRYDLPSGDTVFAAHAGLLPGAWHAPRVYDLAWMKYVDPDDWDRTAKDEFEGAVRWTDLWECPATPPNVSVVYGHDAKRGLTLANHTLGLDGACVAGGQLAALDYHVSVGGYKRTLHVVSCDYVTGGYPV